MFAGEYENYADYVRKNREFFPDVYDEDTEEEKEAIVERIDAEIGDCLSPDDELILNEWAYEFANI